MAAGNFSVMAAILQRAAALAAAHLDQWEILDYASAGKPDVPSGTARELADTLAQIRTPEVAVPVSDVAGPREARGVDDCRHPNPLGAVAEFRGQHRNRLRRRRRAADHAP